MIYFLNRGLILEQEVETAIENYICHLRTQEYYKNYSISVTNDHPFAQLLADDKQEISASSLFPVIIVTSEEDSKPAELSALVDSVDSISIDPDDLAAGDDGKSVIERRYDMITPEIMQELRDSMEAREDKRIFGSSFFIRRRDRISVEIWAENPQLKNELYEAVRLFICGFMKDYLAENYKRYFSELEESSPLVIYDSSVRGQRSNNYNLEFGIELHGSQISFEADYIIEQTVIDTEIVDQNNLLLEVINHVREYDKTTREWIAVGDAKPPEDNGDASTGGSGESADPDIDTEGESEIGEEETEEAENGSP